jgi:hypothetical protein
MDVCPGVNLAVRALASLILLSVLHFLSVNPLCLLAAVEVRLDGDGVLLVFLMGLSLF